MKMLISVKKIVLTAEGSLQKYKFLILCRLMLEGIRLTRGCGKECKSLSQTFANPEMSAISA
jgi:hypothetical protein